MPRPDYTALAKARGSQLASKATPPQVRYLNDLLDVLGFVTRQQRNAYLSRITEREVKFVDDLTLQEATKLIRELTAQDDE